jgi:acyl dehydratase
MFNLYWLIGVQPMIAATTAYTILNDGYMPLPPLSLPAYRELVGKEVGRSDWIRIDQAMIDAFAALTGDDQFIHIDPERAAMTPFGTTIAHGFLTLAIIGGLGPKIVPPIEGAREGLNFGLEHVRFVTPVPSGARIRALFTLNGIEERAPGQIAKRLGVVVELENSEKPALVAEWLTVSLIHD